jgi:hypothetical protein
MILSVLIIGSLTISAPANANKRDGTKGELSASKNPGNEEQGQGAIKFSTKIPKTQPLVNVELEGGNSEISEAEPKIVAPPPVVTQQPLDSTIGNQAGSCGGSKATYNSTCNLSVFGIKYQEFPDLGNSIGNSYQPDSNGLVSQRPQFGFYVNFSGYPKTCEKPQLPAVWTPSNPKNPKGVGKWLLPPIETYRCDVPDYRKWVGAKPGEVVTPQTPGMIENASGTTITSNGFAAKAASCTTPFSYTGELTESAGGATHSWDVKLPNGKPFTQPYVGYRVQWVAPSTDWVVNNKNNYGCLAPAAAKIQQERCLTVLNGDIRAFIPSPVETWTAPKSTVSETVRKLNKTNWSIKQTPQVTKYGKISQGKLSPDGLAECRNSSNASLKFPQDFRNWGFGRFRINISANYEWMDVIRFSNTAAFGKFPADIPIRVTPTADVLDINNRGGSTANAANIWQATYYQFCSPKASQSAGAVANGVTAKLYLTKSNFFWRPAPINEAEMSYSALDCEQKSATDGTSWTCDDPGLQSWDGVNVNGARALQTQADNVRRDAVFGLITPRSTTGQPTIRNILDKEITYETLANASPRLSGSTTRQQQPLVNQPFTFKFGPKSTALGQKNDLWATAGDKYDTNGNLTSPAWDLNNRTLATAFREASRDGNDFPVRPVYGFNAEFLALETNLNSFNPAGGVLSFTQNENWIESSVKCFGPWIAIDAKRVGVIPG